MDSAVGHLASPRWGCPIRTSPDHSLLAAPRGLSQPSTSFIGSWCQGIHRAPLLARRLDLSTSPSRQDQRSHQKDLILICRSARPRQAAERSVLLNYSSILQVRRGVPVWAQKRPDVRRAITASGDRQELCDWRLQRSDVPSLLNPCGAHDTMSFRAPRIFTISRSLSGMQAVCVTSFSSGAEGIRTPDLRRAKAALSQLSYGPWLRSATSTRRRRGGPAWNRTRDLSLIRTAL
jgi:hypothetical protein